MFIGGPTIFFHPRFIGNNGPRLSDCHRKNPDHGHNKRILGACGRRLDLREILLIEYGGCFFGSLQ